MPKKITKEVWIDRLININRNYVSKYLHSLEQIFNLSEEISQMRKRTIRIRVEMFVKKNIPSPLSRTKRLLRMPHGTTIYRLLLLHHDKATIRNIWTQYLEKQAYTNSFEYKQKQYGWTEKEFKAYNQKRANTLQNNIIRFGAVEGQKKWDSYCKRQQYAGVHLDYFVGKYGAAKGLEIYKEINERKKHSLESYIKYHGEELGKERWVQFVHSRATIPGFWSKISQELFSKIDLFYPNDKTYFATKNKEFGIMSSEKYIFVDYVNVTKKKIIEFNGDYWHANSNLYSGSDIIFNNQTAEEIWKKDENRTKIIKDAGFDLLIIWESEFRKDPNGCIERCMKFLSI